MGLAICHSTISKHGGSITVNSTGDQGTSFTLYLPAVPGGESKKTEDTPELAAPGEPARIMIMDDEEMVLNVVKLQLEILGHEPVLVADGDQAISRYQELQNNGTPIDIVIMDLTIPGGMGGRQAAKELLQIDPQAILIASSGYSNDPIMANYRDYGFSAAVAKPIDLEKLSKAIETASQK